MNDKEEILEAMQSVSKLKMDEQIREVDKKGLWDADLVTVKLGDFAEALSQRVASEEDVGTFIHQTKAWQALHLELIAPILADAKKGIAKALKENFIVIRRG